MKILIACIPTPGNRYLIDLKKGLEAYATVVWDADAFWNCEGDFDVVHIHWPEYLSYEIESYLYNNKSIPNGLWQKLNKYLNYWSKRAKIVYTRHNALPHSRQNTDFRELYKLISSNAQTVVHFANYSIQQFKEWYPELDHIKHVVIPHHNYASLPNSSDRVSARAKLGINPDTFVMLVFGGVRKSERQIIKQAFKYIPTSNKLLLAPKWQTNRRSIRPIFFREWIYAIEKWLMRFNTKQRINLGFIKEKDAHYYLNAADFLFIPRIKELNSGNIALAYTFGLVVVGKNIDNIGEILQQTENPTFNLSNKNSLKKAIEITFNLNRQALGLQNKTLAHKKWNLEQVTKSYFSAL